jgi:hypothetical protein
MGFLQTLTPMQWAMIGAALVAVVLINWGKPLVAWVTTAKATTTTGHPRLEVLAKLDDAYSYFEAEKCPEGMAAIRTAIQHTYHEHAGAS